MAVTVAMVSLFASVAFELYETATASTGSELTRLFVWPKLSLPGESGLPVALGSQLKSVDGVVMVYRNLNLRGRHDSGANYLIVGEEAGGLEQTTDFFPFTPEALAAWKPNPRAAIVTEDTMKELNLHVGQTVELPTGRGPIEIMIVGVSSGGHTSNRIAVHFEYLQEFTKNTGTCSYRVYVKPADFAKVAKAITELTAHSPTPAQVLSDELLTSSWVRRVALIPALLGFLGAFLFMTTILTLANSTAIAIRERRIQTSTLRTLGFRNSTIILLLLGETLAVSLAGAAVALIVCYFALRHGIQLAPSDERLLQSVKLSAPAALAGVAVAIIIPLVGTLPSAFAAVSKPLADALRDRA